MASFFSFVINCLVNLCGSHDNWFKWLLKARLAGGKKARFDFGNL